MSTKVDSATTEPPDPNIIITDRLVLRPPLPTDGDGIYTIRSHPQVIAICFAHQNAQTGAGFQDFMKQKPESKECVCHCDELRVSYEYECEKTETKEQASTANEGAEPKNVGEKHIECHVISLLGAHLIPENGSIFLPEYWGKEYATEALKWRMEWYWKMYSKRLEEGDHLKAMTGLEALSIRDVVRKCGFTWLCTSQWEAEGGDVTLDVWKAARPHEERNNQASS